MPRLLLLTLTTAGAMLAADPFAATWKLNPAKSKFDPGPAPRTLTVRWVQEGIAAHVSFEGLDASGKPFSGKYTALYDGKEHPNPGGPWEWDKVINKQIDENTREDTFYKGGKLYGVEKRVVSPGGGAYTVTGTFYTTRGEQQSTHVFERQ
jgi:hypothetical protein